jgi:hypothetical protein
MFSPRRIRPGYIYEGKINRGRCMMTNQKRKV